MRLRRTIIKANLLDDFLFYLGNADDYRIYGEHRDLSRQDYKAKVKPLISFVGDRMVARGFGVVTESRFKSLRSIRGKLGRKGSLNTPVYDQIGVRFLVQNERAAYLLKDLIEQNYKTVSARFKDYISNPKENGYQSIHITLDFDSYYVEVQIRTFEMHRHASEGAAALYK